MTALPSVHFFRLEATLLRRVTGPDHDWAVS